MSLWREFRGARIAGAALVAVFGLWWATKSAPQVLPSAPTELLHFEKDQLTGIRLTRADGVLHLVKIAGVWEAEGEPWRPSRAVIRRITHQLHELSVRAEVTEGDVDFARYGVGEGAVRVDLEFVDGQTASFLVGNPNPTQVSWYIRPLPGNAVYTVQKAALDYTSLPADEFREAKFAAFDPDAVTSLTADVGGQPLAFLREGEHWRMTTPEAAPASRDRVRSLLGRIGNLKATRFVEDHPADLATWGLQPPHATVRLGIDGGEPITLAISSQSGPGGERFIYRAEDDAVYAVNTDFLDDFRVAARDFHETP